MTNDKIVFEALGEILKEQRAEIDAAIVRAVDNSHDTERKLFVAELTGLKAALGEYVHTQLNRKTACETRKTLNPHLRKGLV